jgi:hypothetical protein
MLNLVALVTGWGLPAKLAKPLLIGAGVLLLIIAVFAAVKIHDHRIISNHDANQRAATTIADRKTMRASPTNPPNSTGARTMVKRTLIAGLLFSAVSGCNNPPAPQSASHPPATDLTCQAKLRRSPTNR